MDRSEWLKEKRRSTEERMDTLFAPVYDLDWGTAIAPTHRRLIDRFLSLCPAGGTVLDAACGTGKYWPLLLGSGRSVVGVDQSQGMLDRARDKFSQVPVEKVGLQELQHDQAFDGVICMDAMEFVPPEHWPLVLGNFYRALRPGGPLYFTVEIATQPDIRHDFVAGQMLGLPVVYGESAHEAGYHYYPGTLRVRAWVEQTRFKFVAEAIGDQYHHLIVVR